MSDTCGFTEEHYGEILRRLAEAGYRSVSFRAYAPGAPGQLILRHDIDVSLSDTLRIARLDAALGVDSVFQFLITSEVYNMASREGQATLRELRCLGHTIGLHIDPTALGIEGAAPEAIQHALERLFRVATDLLGPLDSFSLHRPATYGELELLSEPDVARRLPPSADVLRKSMVYRSDSRREWRQGCICGEIAHLGGQPLQLLLHPIWWTPQPASRDEVVAEQLAQHERAMDRYLAGNLSFYTSRYPGQGGSAKVGK